IDSVPYFGIRNYIQTESGYFPHLISTLYFTRNEKNLCCKLLLFVPELLGMIFVWSMYLYLSLFSIFVMIFIMIIFFTSNILTCFLPSILLTNLYFKKRDNYDDIDENNKCNIYKLFYLCLSIFIFPPIMSNIFRTNYRL